MKKKIEDFVLTIILGLILVGIINLVVWLGADKDSVIILAIAVLGAKLLILDND